MTANVPLTPARIVALILGLPIALAIIGWSAFSAVALADQVSYHVHLSVPVTGRQVRVMIGEADAVVRPGSGRRILVSGTLRGSLARPTFRWHSSAEGLALDSRCSIPGGSCTLSYNITAPGAMPVTVSDSSGDLDASDFHGHVTLSDGSGNLSASRLTGTISLADGSGDIDASGLSGGVVRLNDGSGDLTASGLSGGSVRLIDGSGDIDVTGLAATDVVSTDDSGDITLTFTKVPRRVNITDGSGDIALVLPQGPSYYRVDARSSSGQTSVNVKTRPSSPYVITARDGSGDVSISYG